MPIATVNQQEIYYEIVGKGERLVVIPGLSCDHHWIDPILNHLKGSFEMLLFDNRGVGQSSSPEKEYTCADMAADVKELLERLGWEKVGMLTSSMGGMIGQELMIRSPGLISKAVLTTTATRIRAPIMLEFDVQRDLYGYHLPKEVIVNHQMALCMCDKTLRREEEMDDLRLAMCENPHFQTPIGFEGQLGALRQFDSSRWADQISVPCLVIGASEDIVTPAKDSKALAELLPHGSYSEIEGAGHGVIYEQSGEFAEQVKEFLLG